jgi:hypothetical protein
MPDNNTVGRHSVATHIPGPIAETSTVRHHGHCSDLRVRELAWILQVTEYAARKLCESGAIPAWRAVDSEGSSARLRWNVPAVTLAPLLKSAVARRRLELLITGQIAVPRTRESDQRVPLKKTLGPLVSSDTASVRATNCRSDTTVSQDRVDTSQVTNDNLSKEAGS